MDMNQIITADIFPKFPYNKRIIFPATLIHHVQCNARMPQFIAERRVFSIQKQQLYLFPALPQQRQHIYQQPFSSTDGQSVYHM